MTLSQDLIPNSSIKLRRLGHHVVVSESLKLMFFCIPKVACTQFHQLLRRAENYENWAGSPHHKAPKSLLRLQPRQKIMEMLTSPDWTRAVFMRDPAERLLSGYLDKVVSNPGYGRKALGLDDNLLSFRQFADRMITANADPSGRPKIDPHWRCQTLVGDLNSWWPKINFYGDFSQLAKDSRILLEQLGSWDELGATGWGKEGKNSLFEANNSWNKTSSKQKMADYYTDPIRTAVDQAFQIDHQLRDVLKKQCGWQ